MRGVILEPNSTRIWSLHPFAMMPTAHWVSSAGRGWWANCAWCCLAIGAALQQRVTITTSVEPSATRSSSPRMATTPRALTS